MRLSCSNRLKYCRRSGNTMPEYALVGVMVLLACLTALVLLGGNINQYLLSFGGSLKREAIPSKADMVAGVSAVPGHFGGASGAAPGAMLVFETRSGNTFELPDYPQDVGQAITTIGANGTTELILADMNHLIQQLLQNGDITAKQANLLSALSNQGHEIAKVESLLEAARSQSATRSDFLNASVTYNGQRYAPDALATQIGSAFQGNSVVSGSQIQKFQDLKAQAAAQGALTDPLVSQVISVMSQQIIAVANAEETGISRLSDYNTATLAEALASDPQVLANAIKETPVTGSLDALASTVTHRDSAVICKTGGAMDSGTACAAQ